LIAHIVRTPYLLCIVVYGSCFVSTIPPWPNDVKEGRKERKEVKKRVSECNKDGR
jgi:hypothetical protein